MTSKTEIIKCFREIWKRNTNISHISEIYEIAGNYGITIFINNDIVRTYDNGILYKMNITNDFFKVEII